MEDLDTCIDPPTMEEVKAAIKAMESGKAGGADGMTAEMFKAQGPETLRLLMCIFREIWESKTTPKAWKSLSTYPKRVIWVTATIGEASLCSPLPSRSSARSSIQDWLKHWRSISGRKSQVSALDARALTTSSP